MVTPVKKRSLNRHLNRVPISPMRQIVNEVNNAKKVFARNSASFARHLNSAFKSIGLTPHSPYASPVKKIKPVNKK